MDVLDDLIPAPRRLELDDAEIGADAAKVWEAIRHGNLASSGLVRALFVLRTLPSRLVGRSESGLTVRIDDLQSTPDRPGFQLLAEEAPREFAVGAIGKVWKPDIPFVHVADAAAFRRYDEPGYIKVAWAVRVIPAGPENSRVEFELRVDATDDPSWNRFHRYFLLIGPASHFIRRSFLTQLGRDLGTPEAKRELRPLPGDSFLPDAREQLTHEVAIRADPADIWPWLVQMGCRRAGFYSVDLLDNGGVRSARELHPEFADLKVGDVIPASPESEEGFEVLGLEAPNVLVLGGLYDRKVDKQLPFCTSRPEEFWQVTWAFVLESAQPGTTRLLVRARANFPETGGLRAAVIRPVHHLMQGVQLRQLAARAEGRLPADDWRDVGEGLEGAAIMAFAFLTPFLRSRRLRWGLSREVAERSYPGDELVPEPRWSWTHGVEVEASAEDVWPWVAQIGADRGGFYSYQWLENLAGCRIRNAETVHPEWEVRTGGTLILHPEMPPMRIVALESGRWFLARGAPPPEDRVSGRSWIDVTWLFWVEPLGDGRSRLISRFRSTYSDDLPTRLAAGPALVEPVGFAMDRRMLMGIKQRAETDRRGGMLVR